jgi:translation initiation factor IF-3
MMFFRVNVRSSESAKRSANLVEVAPHAAPPVCRIMDYDKFLSGQKKAQSARRKRKQILAS